MNNQYGISALLIKLTPDPAVSGRLVLSKEVQGSEFLPGLISLAIQQDPGLKQAILKALDLSIAGITVTTPVPAPIVEEKPADTIPFVKRTPGRKKGRK